MSDVRFLRVDPAQACGALAFMLGYSGGSLPLYVDGRWTVDSEIPAGPSAGDRLWRRAGCIDRVGSGQVELGLPVENGYVFRSGVLWCWCESKDSAWRAAQLEHAPSMVLRFGTAASRLCLWLLSRPLRSEDVGRANRRLAYACRAPQTRVEGEKLRVPVPGTFMRVGRVKPAPVLVTQLDLHSVSARDLVRDLKDPPPPWKDRQNTG